MYCTRSLIVSWYILVEHWEIDLTLSWSNQWTILLFRLCISGEIRSSATEVWISSEGSPDLWKRMPEPPLVAAGRLGSCVRCARSAEERVGAMRRASVRQEPWVVPLEYHQILTRNTTQPHRHWHNAGHTSQLCSHSEPSKGKQKGAPKGKTPQNFAMRPVGSVS